MKKILITGANSFIARNLAELLNYDLVPLSHSELDLLDSKKVTDFLKQEKFDIVIHTATYTKDTNNMLSNNINMFTHLFINREHYDKMLNFGSGAEFSEEKNNPYNISKRCMNHLCQETNIYNLRLFATYGKYDKSERPIPSLILQSLRKDKLILNVNYNYDYLYMKDLGRIIEWFIENKPKYNSYNVSTNISTSFYIIAQIISSFSGNLPIEILDSNSKKEYIGNNYKLLDELKNFKFTPLRLGLKEVFDWYRSEANV